MPRRGDEFDPEAAAVEDDIAERVDLDFAAVAASGADLAQPQRPPEQAAQLPARRFDLHRAIAGYRQPGAVRCGKPPVLRKGDRLPGAGGGALAAEDAPPEVDFGPGSGHPQCIGRTDLDAPGAT